MYPNPRSGVILALACVVLSVQLGVVQHSIEAAPQHIDAVCGYCLAADHTTPVQPDTPVGRSHFDHESNAVATVLAVPTSTTDAGHPVRAPPVST